MSTYLQTIILAVGMTARSGHADASHAEAAMAILNLYKCQPTRIGHRSDQLESFDFGQSEHRSVFTALLRADFERAMNSNSYQPIGNELAEDIYTQMVDLFFLRDIDVSQFPPNKEAEYNVILTGGKRCSLWYSPTTEFWEIRTAGNDPILVGSQQGNKQGIVLLPNEFIPRIVLSYEQSEIKRDDLIADLSGIAALLESDPDAVQAAVQSSLLENGGLNPDSGKQAFDAAAKLLK